MNNLRPATLDQFVGQPAVRRIMAVLISAARKRSEPVPHTLMSGPPGLGKTTLARIVAGEMGGRLVEMVGSSIKAPADLTQHLLHLKANDVLFIDEIHAVPRRIEEILYPAMEDNTVSVEQRGFSDLMKQLGVAHSEKSVSTHRLPPFTLIGATTLQGLISAPLRSRFRQILELQPYTATELQRIVSGTAAKLAFSLSDDLALDIARRSRGTARVAVSHLLWFRDVVQGDGRVATAELLRLAFDMKGVDELGLTETDRSYLRYLIEAEDAVGLNTLASVLGESVETITESLEPFLLRQGLVERTAKGRIPTAKARELFAEVAA
jgi:Holliday junction DNA helicase RuvB